VGLDFGQQEGFGGVGGYEGEEVDLVGQGVEDCDCGVPGD
jgi:hypothetical protein